MKNSTVTQLSNVRGLNSVGGFVGYSGKSGVVKADKIDVLGDNTGQLLGGALGVMDIFGSHIDECTVTGTDDGYTVQSANGEEQMAEDLSDMQTLQGCRSVQQAMRRTRKLD